MLADLAEACRWPGVKGVWDGRGVCGGGDRGVGATGVCGVAGVCGDGRGEGTTGLCMG